MKARYTEFPVLAALCLPPPRPAGINVSTAPLKSGRYHSARRQRQRAWAVEAMGARCAECGKADGPFEFDHIVPENRSVMNQGTWGSQSLFSAAAPKIMEALEGAQLLCPPCHVSKTLRERAGARGGPKPRTTKAQWLEWGRNLLDRRMVEDWT